jgi:pyruvate dehydrogenase E2 component (dihydrolipoamide acetyltransferase)
MPDATIDHPKRSGPTGTMTLADDCWLLRAPRLNANDDAVTVTRWIVPDRTGVEAGQPVAEIETEKATVEVSAQTGGVLVHAVATGAKTPIGAPLAAVGPTAVAAENALRDHIRPARAAQANAQATPKAQALAARHGVDLARVTATGGTIKERDVARHLAEQGIAASAIVDDPRFVLTGPAPAHRLRVARDLRAAMQAGIFTTLAYRLDLRGPERAIAGELTRGRTASLLVLLLAALGRTLPQFPDLVSVIARDTIYRYRDVDIAFAARSPAGELQAPVVRQVDRLSIDEIARECARLAKRAMRGKLDGRDVGGACFTVSVIATPNVESFVALPPPAQTAILALGATRHDADRPLAIATITYDHALCDGVYVAEFCAALDRALNPEPA